MGHFQETAVLGINLDRKSTRSMGSQLCDQLRSLILSGRLRSGERLPSTRELAEDLGISRTLVLEAFEQLEAEGYVEGLHGSGSFVREGASLARRRAQTEAGSDGRAGAALARRRTFPPVARAAAAVDFRPGRPDLGLFPREAWARALAEASRSLPEAAFGYGDGAGLPELREEIAAFLFRSRGISAGPEDIFVTSGISQSLGMASRFLLHTASGARRAAVLENPCQPALSGLLAREGVSLFAANVDSEGLEPSSLPADRAALAFVTSSHQYPLGAVLSAPRRAALVEWARASDSYIFEDDFDGDFRYGGAPLQPLRELDPERVLYAGSFSKSFSPGLRLGYAIVPPRLRDEWRACRELADIHSCAFTQAAMASFLASGSYERHVARMRKVYAERRAVMLACLCGCFGENVEVMGAAAGLHVAVRFAGSSGGHAPRFEEAAVTRIASGGAIVYPASRYAFAPYAGIRSVLLLGYGHLNPGEIERGVAALAEGLGKGLEKT